MRFKQYIREDYTTKNWEDIKSTLNRDCQSFIKYLRGAKYLLLRGVNSPVMPSRNYEMMSVRKNRKPRLVDSELHKLMGDYSKDKFGWNIREKGLFTTKSEEGAKRWGTPVIIFPIGKFKYVWSANVERLYQKYDAFDIKGTDVWDDIENEIDERYHNTRLDVYLKRPSGVVSECIVNGNKYYQLNMEWYKTIHKYYSSGMDKKDKKDK